MIPRYLSLQSCELLSAPFVNSETVDLVVKVIHLPEVADVTIVYHFCDDFLLSWYFASRVRHHCVLRPSHGR